MKKESRTVHNKILSLVEFIKLKGPGVLRRGPTEPKEQCFVTDTRSDWEPTS